MKNPIYLILSGILLFSACETQDMRNERLSREAEEYGYEFEELMAELENIETEVEEWPEEEIVEEVVVASDPFDVTGYPFSMHVVDFYTQGVSLTDLTNLHELAGYTPVVYFTASWCQPCKAFQSELKNNEDFQEVFEDVSLIVIDIDNDPDNIAGDYWVTGVPTFITIDSDGEIVSMIDGGYWGDNVASEMKPVFERFFDGYYADYEIDVAY